MEDNGSTFLQDEIDKTVKKHGRLGSPLPLKSDGSEYTLDNLENNVEQQQIVYLCIQKIKEWLEIPQIYKSDPSVKFQPLHMTIQEVGGSGKTFLMNVLISEFKRMFEYEESIDGIYFKKAVCTVTAAPTGAAAFKANGKTCHSLFAINFNDYKQEPNN
jgi:hypothetical protein